MIHCKDCIKWSQQNTNSYCGECRNHSPMYDKKDFSVWPITLPNEWCFDAVPKPDLRKN